MTPDTFEAQIRGSQVTFWHRATPWLRYIVKLEHTRKAWRYRMVGGSNFVSVDFDSKSEALEQISDDYNMIVDALERAGFAA